MNGMRILDDILHGIGGHREDSLDSEDSEDFEEEEENNYENMEDQDLDWMSQGPLTLPGILHKMPRHLEKLLMKYDLDKSINAEDHLDNFYLHL